MKKSEILLIIGIAVAAILAFLLLRKSKAEKLIDDILKNNPELSRAEAESIAALQLAEAALARAQTSEEKNRVEERAQATKEAEEKARTEATPEADAAAVTARAELEQAWNQSLTEVEAALSDAEVAAGAAKDAINLQLGRISQTEMNRTAILAKAGNVVWLFRDDNFKGNCSAFSVGDWDTLRPYAIGDDETSAIIIQKYFSVECYREANFVGLSELYEAVYGDYKIPSLSPTFIGNDEISSIKVRPCVKAFDELLVELYAALVRIRENAIAAKTAANLVIERALTLTDVLRLWGVLTARLETVESRCAALKDKLATIAVE